MHGDAEELRVPMSATKMTRHATESSAERLREERAADAAAPSSSAMLSPR